MSKTIYKYTLPLDGGVCKLVLPEGAMVLSVGNQNESLCMWVCLDPKRPGVQERSFVIYGTGHTMPDNEGFFLGTVQFMGGSLVFHVYETTMTLP